MTTIKFTRAVFLLILGFNASQALAGKVTLYEDELVLVSLVWNGTTSDHRIVQGDAVIPGYQKVSDLGYILSSRAREKLPDTKPLFYLSKRSGGSIDSFYTASSEEAAGAVRSSGYQNHGEIGAVFTTQVKRTIPLYRFWHPQRMDHGYPTDSYRQAFVSTQYTDEGIAGYILPACTSKKSRKGRRICHVIKKAGLKAGDKKNKWAKAQQQVKATKRSQAKATARQQTMACQSVIESGKMLKPGQSICSPDKRHKLVCQEDGNMVIYHDGEAGFNTGTHGNSIKGCIMQTDGNLVVYDTNDKPLWNSATHTYAGSFATLTDTGDFIIRNASRDLRVYNKSCNSRLYPGEVLKPGMAICSTNNKHQFACQTDGNFVVYHNGIAGFHTKTHGNQIKGCFMQGDGNLVVYATSGKPLWNSGTHNHPGAHLEILENGGLIMPDVNGNNIRWNAN